MMMMTYLEWGICLMSIFFCWWKYGWNNEALVKGVCQLLKKLEAILVPAPSDSSSITINRNNSSTGDGGGRNVNRIPKAKWNIYNFMTAPTTRIQFEARNKTLNVSSPTENKTKEELVFYSGSSSSFFAGNAKRNPYARCDLCRHTQLYKVSHNLAAKERELDDIAEEVEEEQQKYGLRNCLDCDANNPNKPWYVRQFAFFLMFWRHWYVGAQFSMVSLKDTMADKRLKLAIEDAARQDLKDNPKGPTLDVLLRKHRKRAERVITNMRAKQAKEPYFGIYCRIAAWIIGKTLALIYPKIWVEESQIEAIRKARDSGHPIIYLPIHRSHVDYVLVSWTLFASGLRSPLVAAGENLNIPVFSLMMKSVGGFFIKRRLDRKEGKKDILYRGILHTYMTKSLEDDNDLEFFIEGGRTRTGKPCHPKGGLLSIVVDALVNKSVEDVLIVPVNFSYEKLLEGNYIREQLGQSKIKESFLSATLGLWNSIQTKFGNARVDYGKPFSMREYIYAYQNAKSTSPILKQLSTEICSSSGHSSCSENETTELFHSRRSSIQSDASTMSVFGSDIVIEDQRELVNHLARHVIYDGVKCFSLVSTSAIAFLLLNKYRQGVSMEQLAEELETLKQEFIKRNHSVIFEGDNRQVIEHGLTVLGPALVRRDLVKTNSKSVPTEIILKPVTVVPNVIDLSYYANCVTPIFAVEAVIATSILSMIRRGQTSKQDQTTSEVEIIAMEPELIATCVELCEILDSEFIFNPPCESLVETIKRTLKTMQSDGLVRLQSPPTMTDNDNNYGRLVYISTTPEKLEKLRFYKGLIKPILDTYSVSCHVLRRLVRCEALEKQLQMEMLAEVKTQLLQNNISYGESLGLDPIRNFIKLLLKWEVLESFTKDSISIYYLQTYFDNDRAIDEVVQRIHQFHF